MTKLPKPKENILSCLIRKQGNYFGFYSNLRNRKYLIWFCQINLSVCFGSGSAAFGLFRLVWNDVCSYWCYPLVLSNVIFWRDLEISSMGNGEIELIYLVTCRGRESSRSMSANERKRSSRKLPKVVAICHFY